MLYGIENEEKVGTRVIRRPVKRAENRYTLIESEDGKYYALFIDGEGNKNETEVSREVFEQMMEWAKEDCRRIREDERHLELSELTEESIARRSLKPQELLAESLIRKELSAVLQDKLMGLTELQRRRVELLVDGKSLVEIAEMEGCRYQNVQKSILKVREKFNYFRNRGV